MYELCNARRLGLATVSLLGISIALGSNIANSQDTFFDRFAEQPQVAITKLDFEKDVLPLLERRCANCHVGELAKGGFRVNDRDTVLGYIEPGDVEGSTLWADYLKADSPHIDPATMVMPLNGPLSDRELSVIEDWIEQGADWPETVRFVSTSGVESIEREPIEPEGLLQRISAFSGYFHPAVVHFPIALLVFGGAAAGLSFLTGGRAVFIAFYCLIWGTLFSIIATYMGWCLAAEKGYPDWTTVPNNESIEAASAVFRHRWLGTIAMLLGIAVSICAMVASRKPQSILRHVWRGGLIITALLISIVGHQGGELVYGDIIAKAFSRLLGE
jgi:uncharacterized membrane protein